MSDSGWLQSAAPPLTTARTRNITVAPTGSPETTVRVWRVVVTAAHVLPPSTLVYQS